MRHRKVVSLYEADVAHARILDYLDGIEGRTRQAQALLTMLLVGSRVVIDLESGEEAYWNTRNPDVRKVRREAGARNQRLPAEKPEARSEKEVTSVERLPALAAPPAKPAERVQAPIVAQPPAPTPVVVESSVREPLSVDYDDEESMDPLLRLQMMGEE
jgi:hypothetical protein